MPRQNAHSKYNVRKPKQMDNKSTATKQQMSHVEFKWNMLFEHMFKESNVNRHDNSYEKQM